MLRRPRHPVIWGHVTVERVVYRDRNFANPVTSADALVVIPPEKLTAR
jgi:hypothetical protein